MTMDTSRREFLRYGASLTLGAAAAPYLNGCTTAPRPAKLGTVVGAGKFVAPDKTSTILCVMDLDRPDEPLAMVFDLGFYGHGFHPNPLDSNRAVVFEKRGPGACEVDVSAGKVLRTITTKSNHQFYGHGAFASDGATLYCTETILNKDYEGVLVVRDGKTFAPLGQLQTHGVRPHDCTLIDDGKVMVVTNAGAPIRQQSRPNCTYIEVGSGKLLDKIEFDSDLITAGHLEIAANGDLLCVSAPRHGLADEAQQPGAFSIRRKGGGHRFTTMVEPRDVVQKMTAETLSVAIHEPTATAAATNPAGNLITFWDLAKGVYRGKMEIDEPRGANLTRDGSEFVFSFGKRAPGLVRVHPNTLEEVPGSRIAKSGITGSHLFTYDFHRKA